MNKQDFKNKKSKIEIISTWRDFFNTASLYRRFFEQLEEANIFLSWEWLSNWAKIYGDSRTPLSFIVREAEQVIGLASFYSDEATLGYFKPLRAIRFMGDQPVSSEYLDILAWDNSRHRVWKTIFEYLDSHSQDWDVLFFDDMYNRSPSLPVLRQLCSQFKWPIIENPKNICPQLKLPSNYDDYRKLLPPRSLLHQTENKWRKLNRKYSVSLHHCQNNNGVVEDMETLFRLHRMACQRKNLPDGFASQKKRNFYIAIANDFLQTGKLAFSTLQIDGKAVASHFSFIHQKRLFYLQAGFDPRWAKYSVGSVLLHQLIRDCIAKRIEILDFLRGNETYKFAWGAHPEHTTTFIVINPRLGMRPFYFLKKIKHLIKRNYMLFGKTSHWK